MRAGELPGVVGSGLYSSRQLPPNIYPHIVVEINYFSFV
jgi:hypothetical protein